MPGPGYKAGLGPTSSPKAKKIVRRSVASGRPASTYAPPLPKRVATASVTAVANPSRSSAATTRSTQRAAKRREKTIRRIIRKEPEVAARRVEKRVQRTLKRADYERRPQIEIGGRRERPDTKRTTVISRSTARQVLSTQPQERKRAVRKLAHATVQSPKTPKHIAIVKRERGKGVEVKVEPRRTRAEKVEKREVIQRLRKAAKRSQGGLARKLNRGFAPGETLTPRQTAIVAEAHGLPGVTYAKAIAPGESGQQPGVRNPDDGTPSLFQITPSVQSAATKAKFDKIASKHPGGYSNPIVAAKQARVLAKGTSNAGVSNYVAFNPSAPQGHLPGGKKAARRKLYGEPKPIPKPLKKKAKEVLGKEKTKAVIKTAKAPKVSTTKPVPLKELKKHVKFTEPKSEVRAEQGAPARTSLTKMTPELQRALVKLSKQTGIPVQINEGYRTAKRANEFPSGTASQHHQGNAADVNNHGQYTAAQLQAAGLTNTAVAGEPWHFQPTRMGTPTAAATAGVSGLVGAATTTAGAVASVASGPAARKKAKKLDGRQRSRLIRNLIAKTPDVALRGSGYERLTPSWESYVAGITDTLDL